MTAELHQNASLFQPLPLILKHSDPNTPNCLEPPLRWTVSPLTSVTGCSGWSLWMWWRWWEGSVGILYVCWEQASVAARLYTC